MLQEIKTQLSKNFWKAILSFLGTTLITVIAKYQDNLAHKLFELPPLFVLWTLAILMILVFTLFIALYPKLWLYWDPVVGTWNNRLSHQKHCGVCRSKKLISPLKNEKIGWSCVACNKFYIDSTKNQNQNQNQTLQRTYVTTARMRT